MKKFFGVIGFILGYWGWIDGRGFVEIGVNNLVISLNELFDCICLEISII